MEPLRPEVHHGGRRGREELTELSGALGRFGHTAFRAGQREVVEAVLATFRDP